MQCVDHSSPPACGSTANAAQAKQPEPRKRVMQMVAKQFDYHAVKDSVTQAGSTLDNLKAAVTGETGASAMYAACAEQAAKEGYNQLARLWRCTSAAEQIHINFEYNLVSELDPEWEKPVAEYVPVPEIDLDLIASAKGEIYETSDMYPTFIRIAKEEGNEKAAAAFTRAKLAEAYHAERYLDAYTNLATPSDETYYLCPICGYIHKGKTDQPCPICGCPADKFVAY